MATSLSEETSHALRDFEDTADIFAPDFDGLCARIRAEDPLATPDSSFSQHVLDAVSRLVGPPEASNRRRRNLRSAITGLAKSGWNLRPSHIVFYFGLSTLSNDSFVRALFKSSKSGGHLPTFIRAVQQARDTRREEESTTGRTQRQWHYLDCANATSSLQLPTPVERPHPNSRLEHARRRPDTHDDDNDNGDGDEDDNAGSEDLDERGSGSPQVPTRNITSKTVRRQPSASAVKEKAEVTRSEAAHPGTVPIVEDEFEDHASAESGADGKVNEEAQATNERSVRDGADEIPIESENHMRSNFAHHRKNPPVLSPIEEQIEEYVDGAEFVDTYISSDPPVYWQTLQSSRAGQAPTMNKGYVTDSEPGDNTALSIEHGRKVPLPPSSPLSGFGKKRPQVNLGGVPVKRRKRNDFHSSLNPRHVDAASTPEPDWSLNVSKDIPPGDDTQQSYASIDSFQLDRVVDRSTAAASQGNTFQGDLDVTADMTRDDASFNDVNTTKDSTCNDVSLGDLNATVNITANAATLDKVDATGDTAHQDLSVESVDGNSYITLNDSSLDEVDTTGGIPRNASLDDAMDTRKITRRDATLHNVDATIQPTRRDEEDQNGTGNSAPQPSRAAPSVQSDRLSPGRWLSGEDIHTALEIFMPPSIYVVDCANTTSSSDKFQPFAHYAVENLPALVLPINPRGTHWTLAFFQPSTRTCEIWDSWRTTDYAESSAAIATRFVQKLPGQWHVTHAGHGIKQNDDSSCGVFAIMHALFRACSVTLPRVLDVEYARHTLAYARSLHQGVNKPDPPARRRPVLPKGPDMSMLTTVEARVHAVEEETRVLRGYKEEATRFSQSAARSAKTLEQVELALQHTLSEIGNLHALEAGLAAWLTAAAAVPAGFEGSTSAITASFPDAGRAQRKQLTAIRAHLAKVDTLEKVITYTRALRQDIIYEAHATASQ